MLPTQVEEWIDQQGFGEQTNFHPIGGGCINNGMKFGTSSGTYFFLKTNSQTPMDMFAREAEGLEILKVNGGPRVPQVYLYGPDYILMEDLQPAQKSASYWEDFGRQLATLHTHTSRQFGFEHDNYIGSTPQPNQWTDDGYEFFAQQRLIYQVKLASEKGLMNKDGKRAVEKLAGQLKDLIPDQPPCLIHGDLWSGNAMSDKYGNPAIIDPAVHYGWGEADLAMTSLFGSFPRVFYQAYQEVHQLEPGFRERFSLYNLYHLLNHVNLFGASYLGQVNLILRRFA